MDRNSIAWKKAKNLKYGGWVQKHGEVWKWHYIQYGTEYSRGSYCNKDLAVQCNQVKGE